MENQHISNENMISVKVRSIEADYENALEQDKEFSVLKKLKNELRELKKIQRLNENNQDSIANL